MKFIIYDTEQSEVIGGTTIFKGAMITTTLEPLTIDEAADLWGHLQEHRVDFEDAFPGMTLEDAWPT